MGRTIRPAFRRLGHPVHDLRRQAEAALLRFRRDLPQQAHRLRRRPAQGSLRRHREQETPGRIQCRMRCGGTAGIAQMDPHPGQQLVDHDRLGEVVDAADLQPAHDMLGLAQAGHEDDGHVGEVIDRLQPAAGFEAADTRHHGIHQDQIRRDLLGQRQCAFAVERHQHRGTRALDRLGEKAERVRRIVHHQDDVPARLHRPLRKRRFQAGSPIAPCIASARNCAPARAARR